MKGISWCRPWYLDTYQSRRTM